MLIAIIDVSVAATDCARAIDQLQREADAVRRMPGNINFRVFGACDNGTDITILHEWEDMHSFDGYLASEVFARAGSALRLLMTGKPVSRRFDAVLVKTVR